MQTATYITATQANFQEEVISNDQPVLVDFWATWCPPCRAIAPSIEELATEYEGRAKVVKVDVDQNPELAAEFGIRSIPSILYFKDGKVVDTLLGAVPKRTLADKLDAALA